MSQEKERELVVQQRQHEEHLQETLRARATAELDNQTVSDLSEAARESTAEERHHQEHLQDTMHARAIETPAQ